MTLAPRTEWKFNELRFADPEQQGSITVLENVAFGMRDFARQLEQELSVSKTFGEESWNAVRDWERWCREVLTDYRVQFDDHTNGLRAGITQLLYDENQQIIAYNAALQDACLVYGVPFDAADPRKTVALLSQAIEKRALMNTIPHL